MLALGPGPSQPGVDPLLEHGPLELGEDAAHLEQGAAGGGAGVDVLLVKVEVDAEGIDADLTRPQPCWVICSA